MKTRENAKEAMRTSLKEQCGDHLQRRMVGELTNDLITPKTCANRDAAGTGIPNPFRVNSKICYCTDDFVDWLFDDGGHEG